MPLLEDPERVERRPRGGTRAMRDKYNEKWPMTLVMEGVWLMCHHAARDGHMLQRNGVATIFCVAPGSENRRSHKGILDLNTFDMNEVSEGRTPKGEFLLQLNNLHYYSLTGGIGVYCRNGANRSPLCMAAFLIARTGESIPNVVKHLQRVRALTDLNEPAYGFDVAPMQFLTNIEHDLRTLFPYYFRDFKFEQLPDVANERDFHLAYNFLFEPAVPSQRGRSSASADTLEDANPWKRKVESEEGSSRHSKDTKDQKDCSATEQEKEMEKMRREFELLKETQMEDHRKFMESQKQEYNQKRLGQKRDQLGADLLVAVQRNDEPEVEKLLWHESDVLNYTALDSSGMTSLHHAARLVNKRWFFMILDKCPENVDVVTFLNRTPSQWTLLNCLADVPRQKTNFARSEHWEMFMEAADLVTCETALSATGYGTTWAHQLTSRGHGEILTSVLPVMEKKLGKDHVADILNTPVGKNGLGCIDTALKNCMALVPCLRRHGGHELVDAPADWKSQRRRTVDSTCNERSDMAQKRGSRSDRGYSSNQW